MGNLGSAKFFRLFRADDGIGLWYVWGLAVYARTRPSSTCLAASGPGRAHGRGTSDAEIYRRVANGRWEPVPQSLAAFPYALCSDPEKLGTLYAGFGDGTILRSANAEEGWEEVARVSARFQALAAVTA